MAPPLKLYGVDICMQVSVLGRSSCLKHTNKTKNRNGLSVAHYGQYFTYYQSCICVVINEKLCFLNLSISHTQFRRVSFIQKVEESAGSVRTLYIQDAISAIKHV